MSDNMLVLFDNLLDAAVSLVTSDAAANLPISNLQHAQRSVIWRSNSNGSVTIDMQLDGSFYSHLALVDHNLSVTGTVQVQGWSDAINGASLVFDVSMGAYDYASSFGSGLYGAGGYGGPMAEQFLSPVLVIPTGNIQTAPYVRITLADAAMPYYQIGRIFIGNAWQPLHNMSFGWSVTPVDNTDWQESASKQDYGNINLSHLEVSIPLDWVDDAVRDTLWMQLLKVGFHRSCILQLRPGSGAQRLYLSLYGKFKSRKMTPDRPGNSPFKIDFREDL